MEIVNKNVDNLAEMKNFNTQITNTKCKTIEINLGTEEEFIENNLIDLPFIYFYKVSKNQEKTTTVKYNWTASDSTKREIEIKSSDRGVPNPFDFEVLLSLFNIFLKQHFEDNKILCVKNKEHTEELKDFFETMDNKVTFSYKEIAKELGYKSFSSIVKKNIENSILKLKETTIYNSSQGLYDPCEKIYIDDATYSIDILKDYRGIKYRTITDENGNTKKMVNRKDCKDLNHVKIDKFFLKSLILGNGKIGNKKLRLSLKNNIAKKLYILLNKWQNNRSEAFYKFQTLYERIPLPATKSDYYRKRRVLDALKELKEKEFLINFEEIKDGVNLQFNKSKKKLKEPKDNKNKIQKLLDKYNKYDEVIDKFKEYGITDSIFTKHFELCEIQYYQALLRFVEDRESKIDNIQSYILKGFITKYKEIDKKYYNKPK